ncbi:hypothetical protein PHBOTO_002568 [Pseudozyma hubeiensis]|nr:hypothetical protein PHBOTO_002568 [Pseudozyma hubeiensis]
MPVRTGGTTSVAFHAVFALILFVDVGVFHLQRRARQRGTAVPDPVLNCRSAGQKSLADVCFPNQSSPR